MAKGNSSCHIYTAQGRENHDRIFNRRDLRQMREWFGTSEPFTIDELPQERERLLYEEYDHSRGVDADS
jgi:hypothetical protein